MYVNVLQTTPRNNLDVLFLCLTFVANLALDQYIGEAMVCIRAHIVCTLCGIRSSCNFICRPLSSLSPRAHISHAG